MSLADRLDWSKGSGLLPAIVQDVATGEVRMLGLVNREALGETERSGFVTFYSRSRQRLWRKGESSGNLLSVEAILPDCDADALLILARPAGPTCHTGADSCFGTGAAEVGLLARLAARSGASADESYTARLLAAGVKRIAQKVGEEGVEVALAATGGNPGELASEAADLLYHLTVLLRATGTSWDDVAAELQARR